MLKPIALLLGLFVFLGCNDSNKSTPPSAAPTTTTPTPPQQAAAPATGEALYPSITNEEMSNLWNNTTSVDYLFYELPMSMNMTDPPAIQSTLKQISSTPALINKACKPMGRVFFQQNGEGLAEADFYFAPGCTYFVFMENQKPVKGNQMTREGVQFFQNLLDNAERQK